MMTAPGERQGEQLESEALEATLARARALASTGDKAGAVRELQACANKVAVSPRCEGELGMLLAPNKRRRADALYYLQEAVKVPDDKADVDFYRRLAHTLRTKGRSVDAARGFGYVLTKEPDKAENYADLAVALQGLPERLEEAADALETARGLKSSDPWLYDEALLRGQIAGQTDRAAILLQTYIDHTRGQDPARDRLLSGRVVEFREVAEMENSGKPGAKKSTTAGKKPNAPASAAKGAPVQ
jgi:tetratricopeptide (TPR) repeat protein